MIKIKRLFNVSKINKLQPNIDNISEKKIISKNNTLEKYKLVNLLIIPKLLILYSIKINKILSKSKQLITQQKQNNIKKQITS
jgi:hypothetical protein